MDEIRGELARLGTRSAGGRAQDLLSYFVSTCETKEPKGVLRRYAEGVIVRRSHMPHMATRRSGPTTKKFAMNQDRQK